MFPKSECGREGRKEQVGRRTVDKGRPGWLDGVELVEIGSCAGACAASALDWPANSGHGYGGRALLFRFMQVVSGEGVRLA